MNFNKSNTQPVIQIRELEHSYGRNKVLHGLNFDVEPGTSFGLLGKNGAGKTTTINIMMGFIKPDSGICNIFGEQAHSLSNQTKQRIGLLHEGHLSYDFLTIAQTESFYRAFYPTWDRDAYAQMIKKLGLRPSHVINKMSCGQRSQVALAVLMAQNADILILDDFSMGLDAGYRRLFLDHLNTYVREKEKTVLITSHIVQDLERFVDNILVIDKGRMLTKSSLDELVDGFYCYRLNMIQDISILLDDPLILEVSSVGDEVEVICSVPENEASDFFQNRFGYTEKLRTKNVSLEDAFIALTGRY